MKRSNRPIDQTAVPSGLLAFLLLIRFAGRRHARSKRLLVIGDVSPMKKLFIALLSIVLACCSSHDDAGLPDPNVSGSYSHMFTYVLEFHPASGNKAAHFTATLTNISDKALNVLVNVKAFHSSLKITDKNGNKIEAFIEDYRRLLLTAVWEEPAVTIPAKTSISWTVPLSSLVTLHGAPLNLDLIAGSEVASEMRVAVSAKTKFISDNAVQHSKPIVVPQNG